MARQNFFVNFNLYLELSSRNLTQRWAIWCCIIKSVRHSETGARICNVVRVIEWSHIEKLWTWFSSQKCQIHTIAKLKVNNQNGITFKVCATTVPVPKINDEMTNISQQTRHIGNVREKEKDKEREYKKKDPKNNRGNNSNYYYFLPECWA